MPKLDRTYSTIYNFNNAKKEIENYKDFSIEQLFDVFNYLNSVAFNYSIKNPPKMDKTVFSFR
ncbi:MAG: hypothetical protein SGJ15_09295 [Bacteroidota bacterium]|nr:hypothetical protein [Bacteroidota bacterium]